MLQKKDKQTGRHFQSMLWVSLGLGTLYWIVDLVISLLYAQDSSFMYKLIGFDNVGFWQRWLVCQCFFVIFGSHVQHIIDRNQASEDALRKSEERYRTLVERANEAIVVVQEGIVKYVNRASVEISGYTEQELVSRPFIEFVHPDDRGMVEERYRMRLQGEGLEVKQSLRVIARNGDVKWLELGAASIDFEGRPATLNVITDITRDRKVEESQRLLEERLQQADKMEAIGTLAGGIAHDFNNLLTVIQGQASIALMNLEDNDPNYEKIHRIQDQVQSGSDLTRQLLGFARGGRYDVKPSDMNEILKKSSDMFGRTKKEISIQQHLAKDLWSTEVDRGQMEQVFMNLFVNASHAMPRGGDIYLETQNILLDDEKIFPYFMKTGNYVKIKVTDTGTGMDEKTREKIFVPFFTTKGMGRGTGLGLATVYGIIKGHGGMINVESEPGHGTTFTIYLPASEKEVQGEEAAAEEFVTGTETLLLIDDEKSVMETNKELLEAMGYTVYAAGSGQEGLAVYMEKKDKIDLVIVDMIMPGISGGETFDRLREINPGVKVILSSGYSLTGQAQEIMDRGCDGFLQKPFLTEELSGKIRETLD